jgi:esterase/lipase
MKERDIIDNKIKTELSLKDFSQLLERSYFGLVKKSLKILSIISPKATARVAWKIFTTPRLKRKPDPNFLKLGFSDAIEYQGYKIKTYIQNPHESNSILLVHGWEGQASDFVALLLSLLDHRFKVISFDSPAHGLSQGKSANAIDYSSIIQKLAKKHGPFEAIIGHSLGAFASSHALAHAHEHLANKLVTIGAPNKLTTIIHNFIKIFELSNEVELELIKLIENRFNFKVNSSSTAAYSLMATNTQKLFIHDEYDKQVTIDGLDEMSSLNPVAQVHRTYTLGHSRILKDNYTINKIIDFIKS